MSKRFRKFLLFKCRFIGTGGRFIGPDWARIAYNLIQNSNKG